MTACIVLSAGWAVALLGVLMFWMAIELEQMDFLGKLGDPRQARRRSRAHVLLGLLAVLLFGSGLVSCAVEDRVCEFAERTCES